MGCLRWRKKGARWGRPSYVVIAAARNEIRNLRPYPPGIERAKCPLAASRRPVVISPRGRIGLHWAFMAMWEITITCHDGTRLRLSEWRDSAPHKGDVVETLDTGQIIKARIDACREEKVGSSRPPLFQVTATEI